MSKKRCDVSVFEGALDLSLLLFLLYCLVLSSCVLPFIAQAQENSPGPVISREVDLVVLPVIVKDRNGRFVSGLASKQFQVYEDGQLQEIALFRQEDIPVTVGLVVDHSSSMTAKNPEVLSGALAFVRASNPQDLEFVVNFSDTVSFDLPAGAAFTASMSALQAGITARIDSGRTALYDALTAALRHIQSAPLEKKVLLLISDGGNNNSSSFPRFCTWHRPPASPFTPSDCLIPIAPTRTRESSKNWPAIPVARRTFPTPPRKL